MNPIQINLVISIGSLNTIIPKIAVPTVPIPVQIAYAVPNGRFF